MRRGKGIDTLILRIVLGYAKHLASTWIFSLHEDLLENGLFIDWHSTEWAQLEVRGGSMRFEMLDEVQIALLVELMRWMAIQLDNSLSNLHLHEAEGTLTGVLLLQTQVGVDGSTEFSANLVDHRRLTHETRFRIDRGWLGPLTNRLCPHKGQSTVVLVFVTTYGMVLEIVEAASFKGSEVGTQDTTIELI